MAIHTLLLRLATIEPVVIETERINPTSQRYSAGTYVVLDG